MKINVIVIITVKDTLVLGVGGVGHIARYLQKCIVAHNKDDNINLRQSKLQIGSS